MNNIIKDYIYTIDIPIGTSIRLDCPLCNGTKTLSVTSFTDCVKYYCFHAECTKGGIIKEGLTETSFTVVDEMLKPNVPVGLEVEKQHWRRANFSDRFCSYIVENKCDYAMVNKLRLLMLLAGM